MRATVLFDRDGAVLAAAIHDKDCYEGPRPMPSGDSEDVDEFDIPEEMLRERSLDEIFRSMRVDVERRKLVARDGDSPLSA